MKIVLATLHARRSAQAVSLAAGSLAAALPEPLRTGAVLLDLFPGVPAISWRDAILSYAPDLVALPLYSWNRDAALELARLLRVANPNLRLVAGGPEASATAAQTLAEGELDGVIVGEGELSFAELVKSLSRNETPAGIAGLLWRDAATTTVAPAAPPDLASLPSPWLSGTLTPDSGGGVLWETARGCIYACAYCFDARGSHGVRHVPEARLAAELELFVAHGVAQVWLLDSTFNSPPERGKQLLHLLLRYAPELHYHLEARAELLDAETVDLLSRLPCSVQLGLQSVTPDALKILHRSFDRERFEHAVRLLNQHGVTFGIDLIFGLPGDSHAGFVQTLDFALEQRPNHLDIFPLAVLPGTELYRRRSELGITAPEHPPYTVDALPGYPPQELQRSHTLARSCELFYNRGRATGFFVPLASACGVTGSTLLERFYHELQNQFADCEARLASLQSWPLAELHELQQAFARRLLEEAGRPQLVLAMTDLIRFHYHYAESVLGPETPPATAPLPQNWQELSMRLTAGVRLVDFSYEIQDLLDMEGEGLDLEVFADLFRPVGSTALFLRRGGEVACESLSDDFTLLLNSCRSSVPVARLVGESQARDEALELLTLAWEEGLIEAATAAAASP